MTEDRYLCSIVVNGVPHTLRVGGRTTLADVLRDQLGLTGTHINCEQGVCGVCTVIVDDAPARACLVLAVQADGTAVRTVESLAASDGTLSDLQRAFVDHCALQCGFCTPGFLTLLTWYLEHGGSNDEASVREIVGSNLCRCTGYQGIIDATVEVARHTSGPSNGET